MTDFASRYGPWALVTGASSGIGEAFSRQLAMRGMHLVLLARRRSRLERLAAELRERHRIEARVAAVDLAHADFIEQVRAITEPLEIGLLVNSAGFALTGRFVDHCAEQQAALLHVNCRAALLLAHSFGRSMAERGRGGIINVASASAFLPMPFWTHYAATKSYLLALSEGLWFELRAEGVDVLALCPGPTRSAFARVAGTRRVGMEPAAVVALALKSLGKRPVAVAGWGNRLSVLVTRFLSRQALTRLGATVVRAMMSGAMSRQGREKAVIQRPSRR